MRETGVQNEADVIYSLAASKKKSLGPNSILGMGLITCWAEMTLWMERDMSKRHLSWCQQRTKQKLQKKSGQHPIPKSPECTSSKLWIINELSETLRTGWAGQSLVCKFIWKYVEAKVLKVCSQDFSHFVIIKSMATINRLNQTFL